MPPFIKGKPYLEAAGFLGAKTPIGSQLLSSEWSDVPVALRQRAFFSSQVENLRFLQRAQDSISDFLQANQETTQSGELALATGSRAQFVEDMSAFAQSEGMGPIDQSLAGGLRDITSEQRLSLIFNTQIQQANSFGFYKQGMDPLVLDEWPAQRFIRVAAVKQERQSHLQYENQVYLKTDPVWVRINEDFGLPFAPFGWNCKHDLEDVPRAEAEQLGLLDPGEPVEPDTANFNENLKASTHGLVPELLQKLLSEFGDQVEHNEADQTLNWTGD